jgi:hypothetical protein
MQLTTSLKSIVRQKFYSTSNLAEKNSLIEQNNNVLNHYGNTKREKGISVGKEYLPKKLRHVKSIEVNLKDKEYSSKN